MRCDPQALLDNGDKLCTFDQKYEFNALTIFMNIIAHRLNAFISYKDMNIDCLRITQEGRFFSVVSFFRRNIYIFFMDIPKLASHEDHVYNITRYSI